MATARDHPVAESWAPAPPPPPRRRLAPGVLAGVMALALLFGAVGLVAVRQAGGLRDGAGSPEAAARGLLAALDRDRLDAAVLRRAARYLTAEERLLVATYAGRLDAFLAQEGAGPLGEVGLGARDLRLQRVAGEGDVAVLEAVAGTVSLRTPGGGRVQMPLDEARRRLAADSGGAVSSLRVVTLREGRRWYVSVLATGLEWARLAGRGGPADYAKLTPDGQGGSPGAAAPGAASPEAAVRGLAASLGGGLARSVAHLSPAERRAVGAYLPALPAGSAPERTFDDLVGRLDLDVARLRTRTEPLGEDVARVHLAGGGVPDGERPFVVSIRRDGTWYVSMVFTAIDIATARRPG